MALQWSKGTNGQLAIEKRIKKSEYPKLIKPCTQNIKLIKLFIGMQEEMLKMNHKIQKLMSTSTLVYFANG